MRLIITLPPFHTPSILDWTRSITPPAQLKSLGTTWILCNEVLLRKDTRSHINLQWRRIASRSSVRSATLGASKPGLKPSTSKTPTILPCQVPSTYSGILHNLPSSSAPNLETLYIDFFGTIPSTQNCAAAWAHQSTRNKWGRVSPLPPLCLGLPLKKQINW